VNRRDEPTACRLYVLTAASAPVALVLRRGPSDWWHLLHWDLTALTITQGAWFRGNLYPRRCDISPNGRLFGYFALKSEAAKQWPEAYFAVSKVPWLEALVAWKTGGTWTWGCQFSEEGNLRIQGCVEDTPFHGCYPNSFLIEPMNTDWSIRDLCNETKRGWRVVTQDDPLVALVSAEPNLAMRRERPGDPQVTLGLIHHGVDFRQPGIEGARLEYFLQARSDDIMPLSQAIWTDWDQQGRLLMATSGGTLEVCHCQGTNLKTVWTEDLADRVPDPKPAPAWASTW
jgi:hypothetical protein